MHACARTRVSTRYDEFGLSKVVAVILHFVANDLSSVYFEAAKDRLYCTAADSFERRSAQSCVHHILMMLTKAIAPILPHTAEDIHEHTPYSIDASVFYAGWLDVCPEWRQQELEESMASLLVIRGAVNQLVHAATKQQRITCAAETKLHVAVPRLSREDELMTVPLTELPDLFAVSEVIVSSCLPDATWPDSMLDVALTTSNVQVAIFDCRQCSATLEM